LDDILLIRDVATRLKLAERTVDAMLADRQLPGFKVRGQWRIRRDYFERWLNLVGTGRSPEAATAQIMAPAEAEAARIPSFPLSAADPIPPPASAYATAQPTSDSSSAAALPRAEENRWMQLLSERISQAELHRRFAEALGDRVERHTALERRPLELDLVPPLPSRARVYLFNATRPPGGRPTGEHKVQLIMPGQRRGQRGQFDQSDGRIVLLAGYAAEEDVFILWDAGLYPDFAWSRNVQVKAQTIVEATAGRIARQERRLRPRDSELTTEIVLACPPPLLAEAVRLRQDLTRARLAGV
jgi:excisionase family DNA binding protein